MGTLHGGILCDIADAAMGIAYASNLDSVISPAVVKALYHLTGKRYRSLLLVEL